MGGFGLLVGHPSLINPYPLSLKKHPELGAAWDLLLIQHVILDAMNSWDVSASSPHHVEVVWCQRPTYPFSNKLNKRCILRLCSIPLF